MRTNSQDSCSSGKGRVVCLTRSGMRDWRRNLMVAALVGWVAATAPARATTVVLDAVKTGLYGSHGEWTSPDYTTGIQSDLGAETRGMVAFDVSALPPGDITSATLSLRNPYTINDLGGPLELRLYGLPGLDWSNYNGGDFSYLN